MPKVDNQNSAFSQFIDLKYNGDRETWPDFEAEVLTVVNAKIGRFGMKYLESNWPIENGKPVPSEQYDIVDEPEIMVQGTQEAMRLNQALRSDIRSRNKSVDECLRGCAEILSERVSKALNEEFIKQRCEHHAIL